MMFNTEEKVEVPLLSVPVPTEQLPPDAPSFQQDLIFEPSPPQLQRKASKPPKKPQHQFNPLGQALSSSAHKSQQRDSSPASFTEISGLQSYQVEQLMDRVQERAQTLLDDQGERPGLHELMQALDLIIQGGDDDGSDNNENSKPSTEIANTVYRLLIKKEKQKAYDSLVSLQTEIYDLQDQETGILSRSFEKDANKSLQVHKVSSSLLVESQNFTFAPKDTLTNSNSTNQEGRVDRKPIKSKQRSTRQKSNAATPPKAPCYMSESEMKHSNRKSAEINQTVLPPKFLKKRDSMPDLMSGENTRNFLYAEPFSHQMTTQPDLQSHSQQQNCMMTQSGSQKSLSSVWNARSQSAQNMLMSNRSNNDPHYNQRLLQMPVQMNSRRPPIPFSTQLTTVQTPPLMQTQQQLSLQNTTRSQADNNQLYQNQLILHQPVIGGVSSRASEQQSKFVTDAFQIFEEIINLQKSQSFNRRCEKLVKIQKEKANFQESKNIQHGQFQHSFGDEQLNQDLEQVKSARKLPRFSFNAVQEAEQSTSSSEETNQQRAVDSNKAIVVAYYAKKLLQKSLRSLEKHPKEVKAKESLREMASAKHEKVIQLIAFNRIKKHYLVHEGHSRQKLQAQEFFKDKIGRVYLRNWRNKMEDQRSNWQKLLVTTQNLRKGKLLRIFKSWRSTSLELKMLNIQWQTAKHVNKQRVQAKSFGALAAFARYSVRTAYMDNKADQSNRQRLEFKAMKSWQRYVLSRHNKGDMGALADQLRRISLQRQALSMIKEFLMIQEHEMSLRTCAKEFRNLCLQRATIRSLQQYAVDKKVACERRINIRKFYVANLKAKLFRFFHESNIEFIKHFVQVEDYVQRQKMRNVMRVLYKFARIQQAQSCFSKVPSPKDIYVIHLWLKAPNFSFKQVRSVTQHPGSKYKEKQGNADMLLQSLIYSKIFRAWLKQSKKTRAFRKRIENRLLQKVIDTIYASSRVNSVLRRKAKSILSKSDLQTQIRVFRALKMHTSARRRDHKLENTLKSRSKRLMIKQTFGIWFSQYANIDKKRMQKQLSNKLKKKLYTRRFLAVWKKQFERIFKKRSLSERMATFQLEVTKRKFIARWLSLFRKNCALQNKGDQINYVKRHKLLARALYALRKYKDIKIRSQHIRHTMQAHRNSTTLAKCLHAWKKYAPEMQLKTVLCGELTNDYRLKLLRKVFGAFRLNREFRHERTETDSLMTKAVQEISIRKFFKGWRSLAGKRMGLLMFEDTFEKLQVASFFKRGRRKILHEEETCSHMNLLRDYLSLTKAFGAFRKQCQRKDCDNAKTGSFQRIRGILSMKQYFRTWRQQFTHQVTQKQIVHYAVSHVQGSLLKRCFEELRIYGQKSKLVKNLQTKVQEAGQKRIFNAFSKACQMQRLGTKMASDRQQASKQSFFGFWLCEMREKTRIKSLIAGHLFTLAHRSIFALKQNARIQRQRKYMINQGQANNNYHQVKKVFYALAQNGHKQRHRRYVFEHMEEHMNANRQRIAMRALYQGVINTRILSMVYEQVSLRTNRRIACENLQKMRNLAKPRLLKYRACYMLHQKTQKMTLSDSLQRWSQIVMFTKQMEIVTHEFDLYKRTQVMRKVFKALKMVTRAKRAQRNLHFALLEKSHLMKKQAILHAFIETIQRERTNRLNKDVAFTYRYDRVRRSTFNALRSFGLQSRRLKCLTGAAMFQRLVPKAFACLQMNMRVSSVKRSMLIQASQMHQERLIRKSFSAFHNNVCRKQGTHQNRRVADSFAKKKLRQRAFGRLFAGVCVQKDSHQKRQHLFKAVSKWANYTTQKTVFKMFQMAVQQNKVDVLQIRVQFEQTKLQRLFKAWHSLKFYNQKLAQSSQAVKQNQKNQLTRVFFSKWVGRLANHLQVKIFQAKRKTRTLQRSFDSFRLAKNLRKAGKYAVMWNQDFLKRAFFNAVLSMKQRKLENSEKVMQMRSVLDTRLKTRVVLSFKYHLLKMNSQKMITEKLNRMLLTKSLNAIKYFSISQRITNRYSAYREAKIRKSMFTAWRTRHSDIQAQKGRLRPILNELSKNNKLDAFKMWRKNSFRQKFVSTLQQNLLFTSQVDTVQHCLQAWRKFAKFNKNKEFNQSEVTILREYHQKRNMFTEWFNAAMKRAPVTLFCNKIQRAHRRIELRSSFLKVLQIAVYDQDIEGVQAKYRKIQDGRTIAKVFTELKKNMVQGRKSTYVYKRQSYSLVRKIFYNWLQARDQSLIQKQQVLIEEKAMEQAGIFYQQKVIKQSFTALVWNFIKSRQGIQAEAFYKQMLKRRAMTEMAKFAYHERTQGGSLTKKANQFKQRNNSYMVLCFKQWRHRFMQVSREKKIVACFQNYSQTRLLSQAFKGIKAYTGKRRYQRIELDPIAITIRRRQARRIRSETFARMTRIVNMQRELKVQEKANLVKAMQFRKDKLIGNAFDQWNATCRKGTDTQKRSRMYSIFSAWKFYTKERSLLKRYLFECGDSIGDVSAMTTLQLRDAAKQQEGGEKTNTNETASFLQQSRSNNDESMAARTISNLMNSHSSATAGQQQRQVNNDSSIHQMQSGVTTKQFHKGMANRYAQQSNFMRESLPEAKDLRLRHISPDVMLQSHNLNKKNEIKSAEQVHQRKKSSSVMSLLQKQFGDHPKLRQV